jgi:hypothetical protein
VKTIPLNGGPAKIDHNSPHREGREAFLQYRAALKVLRTAYLQELYDRRQAEESDQRARSSEAKAREARETLGNQENLISMMTTGASLMRVISTKHSLMADDSSRRAVVEGIKVLRLKKKLLFLVDRAPVSDIEKAIVRTLGSPAAVAVGPEKIQKRRAVFEEIWGVDADTKTVLAVLAEVGWWIFGPRLAVVMDEAHCRALIIGEAMGALAAAYRRLGTCPLACKGAPEELEKV